MIKYYVELKDTNNADEWGNKVDIYGYNNNVVIIAMGYNKDIKTSGVNNTIETVDDVVSKLKNNGFAVINQERRYLQQA